MPMPTELDHCPITPECRARKLWRDNETGKLYRMDAETNSFKEHFCNNVGLVSALPQYVFTGIWENLRTGRIRYHGPFRMRKSAMSPPPDGGKKPRRRSQEQLDKEWKFLDVVYDECEWKSVKELPTED